MELTNFRINFGTLAFPHVASEGKQACYDVRIRQL
jgi:hypothetical protein